MKHVNNSLNFSVTIVSNALTGGGAEISMYALHKSFLSQGFDCNLIALNESDANLLGLNTVSLNRRWKSGIFSTVSNFLQFRKVIKYIKSDLIFIFVSLAVAAVLLYFLIDSVKKWYKKAMTPTNQEEQKITL